MGQDRAVSDDQRPTLKPNKISHIDRNDDRLGRQPANRKTVYTSSILVVASIHIINALRWLSERLQEILRRSTGGVPAFGKRYQAANTRMSLRSCGLQATAHRLGNHEATGSSFETRPDDRSSGWRAG